MPKTMKLPLRQIGEITYEFFKMGLVAFGGGFAMIPMIQEGLIDEKKWLEQDKLVEVLAVAQSLPGSLSINTSIFIGYEVAGVPGALAAVTGIAIPPFLTITAIAAFFGKFQGNPVVDAAFMGVRCAVVALIWNSGLGTAKFAVKDLLSKAILGFTIVIMIFSSLNPALLMLVFALFGIGARLVLSWKQRRQQENRSV